MLNPDGTGLEKHKIRDWFEDPVVHLAIMNERGVHQRDVAVVRWRGLYLDLPKLQWFFLFSSCITY